MAKDDDNTQKQLLNKISQLEANIYGLEKSEIKSSTWIENSPVCTKILDLDFKSSIYE